MLKLNQKGLFIFDFDGVLVDSVQVKTQAFASLYQNFGEDVVNKVTEYHLGNGGMSRFEKFRYYHQYILGLTIDDDLVEEMSQKFSKLVVDKIVSSKEINGVTEFLENCMDRGVVCCVNSATPEDELVRIIRLRNWSKYFQFIFGSPSSKFKNSEKILSKTNICRTVAVFFGDDVNDFNAAKASNIDFIGINYSAKNKTNPDQYVDFSQIEF